MSNVERMYLSKEEAVKRLHGLTPEVVARILSISSVHAYGTGMEVEDLLHESLARVIDGTRQWPVDVDIVAFLKQTIRSVASHRRDELKKKPEVLETDIADPGGEHDDGLGGIDQMLVDEVNTPYHEVTAEQLVNDIHQQFADDMAVLTVLMMQVEGWAREEGCERTGLTSNEYSAAIKRLRRGLDSQYGKRAKL